MTEMWITWWAHFKIQVNANGQFPAIYSSGSSKVHSSDGFRTGKLSCGTGLIAIVSFEYSIGLLFLAENPNTFKKNSHMLCSRHIIWTPNVIVFQVPLSQALKNPAQYEQMRGTHSLSLAPILQRTDMLSSQKQSVTCTCIHDKYSIVAITTLRHLNQSSCKTSTESISLHRY